MSFVPYRMLKPTHHVYIIYILSMEFTTERLYYSTWNDHIRSSRSSSTNMETLLSKVTIPAPSGGQRNNYCIDACAIYWEEHQLILLCGITQYMDLSQRFHGQNCPKCPTEVAPLTSTTHTTCRLVSKTTTNLSMWIARYGPPSACPHKVGTILSWRIGTILYHYAFVENQIWSSHNFLLVMLQNSEYPLQRFYYAH